MFSSLLRECNVCWGIYIKYTRPYFFSSISSLTKKDNITKSKTKRTRNFKKNKALIRIIKILKREQMLLSRSNHFTWKQQGFYNTYIFKLLFYSLSLYFLRFQNPLLLVLQVLLNGNLKRRYSPYMCFAILKSLAAILGSSMKWKLKGKMLYSLSNAFLSIRGQWNGFFFICVFPSF